MDTTEIKIKKTSEAQKRANKIYREKNKEILKLKMKQYQEKNRELINKISRDYYNKNKDDIEFKQYCTAKTLKSYYKNKSLKEL